MTAEVIDILVAIDVPFNWTQSSSHIDGIRIEMPAVMRDPARHQRLRLGCQSGGARGLRLISLD